MKGSRKCGKYELACSPINRDSYGYQKNKEGPKAKKLAFTPVNAGIGMGNLHSVAILEVYFMLTSAQVPKGRETLPIPLNPGA